MMITLMLALALITIALLGVLPDIKQQIRRDREEELIHRGTAYMRAIQHFNTKFGRYPSRLEELENTNNLHFIRKHYTDPVNRDPATGKEREFRLLHQQDIILNNGPLLPGAGPSTSPFQPAPTTNSTTADPNKPAAGTTPDSDSAASASNPGSGFNGPTFGGGPILGVASLSKEKTIRVFFDKNHYKDWLFIYSPNLVRAGGLLTGPVNPNMPAGNLNPPGALPNVNPNPAFNPNSGSIPGSTPPPAANTPPQDPGQSPPPTDPGQTPPQP